MVVPNGDRITSVVCCHNLIISINQEQFFLDCYTISLGGFDLVLGVQWLSSLGPFEGAGYHEVLS